MIQVDTISSGRGPVEIRVELLQGLQRATVALDRVGSRRWAFGIRVAVHHRTQVALRQDVVRARCGSCGGARDGDWHASVAAPIAACRRGDDRRGRAVYRHEPVGLEQRRPPNKGMKLTKLSAAWLPGWTCRLMPAPATIGRGHRFAAYPRCSADFASGARPVDVAGGRSAA